MFTLTNVSIYEKRSKHTNNPKIYCHKYSCSSSVCVELPAPHIFSFEICPRNGCTIYHVKYDKFSHPYRAAAS